MWEGPALCGRGHPWTGAPGVMRKETNTQRSLLASASFSVSRSVPLSSCPSVQPRCGSACLLSIKVVVRTLEVASELKAALHACSHLNDLYAW